MSLVTFKDLPDTSTPANASNLNNNFNEVKNSNAYGTSQSNGYSQEYSNNTYGGITLFESPTRAGDNGEITLSDSINNYSSIEIFYKRTDALLNYVGTSYNKIFNPSVNSTFTLSTEGLTNTYVYKSITSYSMSNNKINPSKYTLETRTISSGNINYDQSTNDIYIRKVVGYK